MGVVQFVVSLAFGHQGAVSLAQRAQTVHRACMCKRLTSSIAVVQQ
jgi:hypothetical protein